MRALVLAALLASCAEVPGACDEPASTAVAFTEEGVPAYEGQALMVRSCGFGAFCHSEEIDPEARRGVPLGLDFDVRIAAIGPQSNLVSVDRLGRHQERVYDLRGAIWAQVSSGAMPPGDEGRAVREGAPVYERVRPGASRGEPLPEVETPAGRELLRNWLACGSPVIERTQPRGDRQANTVGFTVPLTCAEPTQCAFPTTSRCDLAMNFCVPCEGDPDCAHLEGRPICDAGECVEPIEPTWASIYPGVIERRCALAGCHAIGADGRAPAGALGLEGAAAAHASLVGVLADGSATCRATGLLRVAPGDPDASLLMHKLEGEAPDGFHVCAERMPLGRDALPAVHLAAIRAWIAAGALP